MQWCSQRRIRIEKREKREVCDTKDRESRAKRPDGMPFLVNRKSVLSLCVCFTWHVFNFAQSLEAKWLQKKENAADSEFKSAAGEEKYFEWTTACMVRAFQFLSVPLLRVASNHRESVGRKSLFFLVTCFRVYMSRHTVNFGVKIPYQTEGTHR